MQKKLDDKLFKQEKIKIAGSNFRRVTARVKSLDFENKKIILDCYGNEAYCDYINVGFVKYQDISRIFRPNSVHTFAKEEGDDDVTPFSLNYQKVHPETMKPGKVKIVPTCSGSKNLKRYLFKLIGRNEKDEEGSNNIS